MNNAPVEVRHANQEELRQFLLQLAGNFVDQLFAGLNDNAYGGRVCTEFAWQHDMDGGQPLSFSLHCLLLDNMTATPPEVT